MEKKLKVGMFGHKRVPSREGGIEIVVEELAKLRDMIFTHPTMAESLNELFAV